MSALTSLQRTGISRISRETPHIWVLSIALILTYAMPSFIYSALFCIFLVGYLFPKFTVIDIRLSRVFKPIFLMTLLGLIFSFNNAPIDIARDFWHILKAISCIMLGYVLARRIYRFHRFLKQFLVLSLIFSLVYIAPFLLGLREIGLNNQGYATHIPLATAIVFPLLLVRRNGLVDFGSAPFRFFVFLTILFAYGLSLSRTALGCAIIMMLVVIFSVDNAKRLLLVIIMVCTLVFVTFPLSTSIDSSDITFFSKARNSLSEIAFTDDSDPRAMIINWRGFEAYRAFVEFVNSTPLQQLVGRGVGATVDLGTSVQMSDEMNFQFIPVLHNGYLHILIKYGLIGFVLYLVFLWRISNQPNEIGIDRGSRTTYRLLFGMSIILAYTTLVISGIFNKQNLDSILIMIGVFMGHAEIRRTPNLLHASQILN